MTQKINQSIGLATEVMMALLFNCFCKWWNTRYKSLLSSNILVSSFEETFCCGKDNKLALRTKKKRLILFSKSLHGFRITHVEFRNVPTGAISMKGVATFYLRETNPCSNKKEAVVSIYFLEDYSREDIKSRRLENFDRVIVCDKHFNSKWHGKTILQYEECNERFS